MELLAVRDDSSLTLLAHNHNSPEREINTENVVVALKGVSPQSVSIRRVDDTHANPKQAWIELGSPMYPTPAQFAQLEQASRPGIEEVVLEAAAEGSVLKFSLPPHGVASVTIRL